MQEEIKERREREREREGGREGGRERRVIENNTEFEIEELATCSLSPRKSNLRFTY